MTLNSVWRTNNCISVLLLHPNFYLLCTLYVPLLWFIFQMLDWGGAIMSHSRIGFCHRFWSPEFVELLTRHFIWGRSACHLCCLHNTPSGGTGHIGSSIQRHSASSFMPCSLGQRQMSVWWLAYKEKCVHIGKHDYPLKQYVQCWELCFF